MNDKQRDPRLNEILYPLYDEKRCIEIINAHEPKQENMDNRELKIKNAFTNPSTVLVIQNWSYIRLFYRLSFQYTSS